MNGAIVGITIAYILLAALLLNLNIYTRQPLWIKLGTILVTVAFYYVTYSSLKNFGGWPASAALPQEFVVLAARVDEPDEKIDKKGAVYLWLLPLKGDKVKNAPRAYRLPYSPALHKQVNTAAKQLRRSIVQMGRVERINTPKSNVLTSWMEERTERIVIYDLDDPELPDK